MINPNFIMANQRNRFTINSFLNLTNRIQAIIKLGSQLCPIECFCHHELRDRDMWLESLKRTLELTILLVSLFATSLTDGIKSTIPDGWIDCSKADDLFVVDSFTFTPNPPKRAHTLTINVKGTLSRNLNGGKINYIVHFGIIPIVQDSLELCEALRMEPKLPQCPLKAGKWDVTHQLELPKGTPFGKYSVAAVGWDGDGREIFCIKGSTSIAISMDERKGESMLTS